MASGRHRRQDTNATLWFGHRKHVGRHRAASNRWLAIGRAATAVSSTTVLLVTGTLWAVL